MADIRRLIRHIGVIVVEFDLTVNGGISENGGLRFTGRNINLESVEIGNRGCERLQ